MPPQLQNEAAMLLGERLVLVLPSPLCHPLDPPTKAILRRPALNDPDSTPGTTPVVSEPEQVERARPRPTPLSPYPAAKDALLGP